MRQGAGLSRLDERIGRVASSDLNVILIGDEKSQLQLSLRIHGASRLRGSVFLYAAPPFSELACLGDNLRGSEEGPNERPRNFQGTLFVSRAAELPPRIQRVLLRMLEQRETPLPDTRLDFRIIAADNGDLPESVKSGVFRHDLYYRLNEVVIRTPASLAQYKSDARSHAEKRVIEKVLARTHGNLPRTAELLSLSPPSLDEKIRGLGIVMTDFSVGGEDLEIDQGGL